MRKPRRDPIVLNEHDYERLMALIHSRGPQLTAELNDELARADVVEDTDFPSGIVAMNSEVTFQDLDSKEKSTIMLVYPHEANVDQMKISILSPVGTALIGLRIGGMIDWPLPHGKTKRLKVTKVSPSRGNAPDA